MHVGFVIDHRFKARSLETASYGGFDQIPALVFKIRVFEELPEVFNFLPVRAVPVSGNHASHAQTLEKLSLQFEI